MAIVVFKAAIQLELARQENDERVVALNVEMCDMMSVLRLCALQVLNAFLTLPLRLYI